MDSTRAGLEAALAADPDDVVTHAAYADYLSECGDPRGDYIRLQLALEDRSQPADRLRAMEQESFRLRQKHEAEWLGPLYPFVHPVRRGRSVAEPVEANVDVQFRRGWVHRLRIGQLTPELADAVAAAPLMRLLAELEVESSDEDPGEFDAALRRWNAASIAAGLKQLVIRDMSAYEPYPVLPDAQATELLLRGAKQIAHLDLSGQSIHMTAVMTDRFRGLESLRLTFDQLYIDGPAFYDASAIAFGSSFPGLRLLHIDLVGNVTYPTDWTPLIRLLANRAVMPVLESLALRLPNFADAGVDALLESGLVARLKALDLCRCQITDDGAQALAADPAVPRLDYLRLDDNYLSPIGIQALADVGVTVSERQRFGPPGTNDPDPPDDVDF